MRIGLGELLASGLHLARAGGGGKMGTAQSFVRRGVSPLVRGLDLVALDLFGRRFQGGELSGELGQTPGNLG